ARPSRSGRPAWLHVRATKAARTRRLVNRPAGSPRPAACSRRKRTSGATSPSEGVPARARKRSTWALATGAVPAAGPPAPLPPPEAAPVGQERRVVQPVVRAHALDRGHVAGAPLARGPARAVQQRRRGGRGAECVGGQAARPPEEAPRAVHLGLPDEVAAD